MDPSKLSLFSARHIETVGTQAQPPILHANKIIENDSFVHDALKSLKLIGNSEHRPAATRINHNMESSARALQAVRGNDIEALRKLLKDEGSKINVCYRDPVTGDTAWGVATRRGDEPMLALLKPFRDAAPQLRGPMRSERTNGGGSSKVQELQRTREQSSSSQPEATLEGGSKPSVVEQATSAPRNETSGAFGPDAASSAQRPGQEHDRSGLFDAIDSGDQAAVKKWLASNKINLDSPDPRTGYTPLLRALVSGQHDIAADLVVAGANPNGVDVNAPDARQKLARSYLTPGCDEEAVLKACSEGRIDIGVAWQFAGTEPSSISKPEPVGNHTPSLVSGIVPVMAQTAPKNLEKEVINHPFFHHIYNENVKEQVLLEPGMFLIRSSRRGGFALTFRNKSESKVNPNSIIDVKIDIKDGMLRAGNKLSYSSIQELLNDALKGTPQQGVISPKSAYDALDSKYKLWGGLALAVKNRDAAALETLVANDKDTKNLNQLSDGKTALTFALETQNARLARRIIDADANLDTPDANKETPVHIAVRTGQLGMLKVLATHGASINMPDANGDTPLHIAARQRQLNLIDALANYGARLMQINTAGETPLDVAKEVAKNEPKGDDNAVFERLTPATQDEEYFSGDE